MSRWTVQTCTFTAALSPAVANLPRVGSVYLRLPEWKRILVRQITLAVFCATDESGNNWLPITRRHIKWGFAGCCELSDTFGSLAGAGNMVAMPALE
jgi:hypothetical protein